MVNAITITNSQKPKPLLYPNCVYQTLLGCEGGLVTFRLIPLTQGKFAIVDTEDFEWLNQWKWRVRNSKHSYYARRNIDAKKKTVIEMHRQITQPQKGQWVDHINHNGLDNRRCNLRLCSISQNAQNRRPLKGNTSIYKGVHFQEASQKWSVSISINRIHSHLGLFDSEVDAAKAYNAKAKELFGEFAWLNKF